MFEPLLWFFDLTSACLVVVLVLYLVTWLHVVRVLPFFTEALHRSMTARVLALAIQYGIWGLVLPSLWLSAVSLGGGEDWIRYFREAVPADGAQWLLLPLPLLAVGLVYLLRLWRARQWSKSPGPQQLPRLLISPVIRFGLVFGTFHTIFAGAAVRFLPSDSALRAAIIPADAFQWIRDVELRAIPTVVILLGTTFLLAGVRLALDVANDVTNYLSLNVRGRPSSTDPDEREVRRPIRGKFNEVMRYLRSEHDPDAFVILAHSLGTVVAVDELAASDFGQERTWLEAKPLRLVTLGSPVAHLFQHYFPLAYPPWTEARWARLHARTDRWLNLYRIDDFVGTSMEMDTSAGDGGFEEEAIGAGGHMDYWKDPRAVRRIAEEIRAAVDGVGETDGPEA
jgi:hypothetical protein